MSGLILRVELVAFFLFFSSKRILKWSRVFIGLVYRVRGEGGVCIDISGFKTDGDFIFYYDSIFHLNFRMKR